MYIHLHLRQTLCKGGAEIPFPVPDKKCPVYLPSELHGANGLHPLSMINSLNAELNPICYLLALLGAHHFLHELITRPEESYRPWCVVVCDLETSRIGALYI